MSRWDARRERFRAVFDGDECVVPASVYDPVSGRIASDLGYEMGVVGGSIASLVVLGAPDLILLTLTELTDQIRRISRACALPLLVDGDHGYGNALNVMRTVAELEDAGAAAITIEDTALPAAHGAEASAMVTMEEARAKIAAAVEARQDPMVVIVGRTSLRLTNLDEVVRRLTAYESAGADALMVVGLESLAQVRVISDAVAGPLIISGGGDAMGAPSDLAALGVRVWMRGHSTFAASTEAVYTTLKRVRDSATTGTSDRLASGELTESVSRSADYARWSERFLS